MTSGKGDFEIDDAVKRALAAWGQERDPEIARLNLKRAFAKLTVEKKAQLIERVAEISLAQLLVIDQED